MDPSDTQCGRFPLGEVVVTRRAADLLRDAGEAIETFLARHRAGDWGEATPQCRAVNDGGIDECCNLSSTYALSSGKRLSVVTLGDRSCTMVHVAPEVAG